MTSPTSSQFGKPDEALQAIHCLQDELDKFHIQIEQHPDSLVDSKQIELWTDRISQISRSSSHFDEESVERIKQIRKKATEDLEKIIRFNDQLESRRNEHQIIWEESWKFFKSSFLPFAILAIGYKLSR